MHIGNILSYEFMQNAVLIAIMASVICGFIGPFIVAKRMVFISGGLSHTALGGLGIAYWLGVKPLYGATVFVLLAAGVIGNMEEKISDLFIGILWAVGVAIGIIFIHLTPGYTPDLMAFLFGNILMAPRTDVIITLILMFIVTLPVLIFYKGFVSVALDEEYARARQLPVKALNMGLISLVALSIVTLIQAVGIILVIALLTIPVAIAGEISINFKRIILLSIVFGIVICLSGLFLSYFLELPSGASIILIGGILLILIKGAKKLSSYYSAKVSG
ncbi:MAG: metal ABC transporter permease [Syntrophales bacterium]|nr:metal ABC transporter permease [Syntrophales bacterium]